MEPVDQLLAQPAFTVRLRPTAREQIADVIERARQAGEPLRIRLPFTLYNYQKNRTYEQVRDAVWNITLADVPPVTPEHVEGIIEALGKCVVALSEQGSEAVMRKLQEPVEGDVPR